MNIDHIRNVWNSEHPKDKIPKGANVWNAIKSKFRKTCKEGRAECIVAHMLTKPEAPESWGVNPEEWLSSDDIENIEKEYKKIFNDYYYVDTVPIDFDKKESGKCIVSALCDIQLSKLLNKGKERVGIVFNTDTSSGPGQHWIALFCDMRSNLKYPQITYFDSYGEKPEKEIVVLMDRWNNQLEEMGFPKPSLQYNKTEDQYQHSECGMYCLYFHFCCLMEIPMDERVSDEFVRGLRGKLFKIKNKK